jgi:hypothetical protein
MSSLHQDRLLVEGSEPATGSASTLTTARGTSRRPAEKKAISSVPTQRQGRAPRSGTAQTLTDGQARVARHRRPAGAETTAGAAGTLASRAKAATNATAKVATARAATAKAVTAKAATAAKAAAAAKVAARTAGTAGRCDGDPGRHAGSREDH